MIDPKTYVFSFGKHDGRKYSDVASSHSGRDYILWAHNNVDRFQLQAEEYERVLDLVGSYYTRKRKEREMRRMRYGMW